MPVTEDPELFKVDKTLEEMLKINEDLYESLKPKMHNRDPSAKPDEDPYQLANVISEYSARDPLELSLEESDVVKVYKMADGRVYGGLNGVKGYFPASCVKLLSAEEIRNEEPESTPDPVTAKNTWYSKYVSRAPDSPKLAPGKLMSQFQISVSRSGSSPNLSASHSATALSGIKERRAAAQRNPGHRYSWVDYMGGLEVVAVLMLSKQEIKRQEVIFEIISTEADYIQDLETILELYIRPLQKSKLIRTKDMSIIFSNLEQVLPVNQV